MIVPHHVDGHLIAQRKSDGYVNATAMCKAAGKEWSNYKQNADTRAVVESLSRSLGIPRDLLILAITTGKNEARGTWVHPKVALHLATWCAPDFYAQVISWVYDEVTTQAPVFKLPQTFAESLRLLADATEANDRLLLKNTELLTYNEELAAVTEELKDVVLEAQAEIVSRTRTAEALMAKIEIPKTCTSLTDFFSINYELLGYSSIAGFELLRDIGFLHKRRAETPKKASRFNRRSTGDMCNHVRVDLKESGYLTECLRFRPSKGTVAEPSTGKEISVMLPTITPYVTPAIKNSSGQTIFAGGFSWLLEYLLKDPRTALSRMQRTPDGIRGRYFRLDEIGRAHV